MSSPLIDWKSESNSKIKKLKNVPKVTFYSSRIHCAFVTSFLKKKENKSNTCCYKTLCFLRANYIKSTRWLKTRIKFKGWNNTKPTLWKSHWIFLSKPFDKNLMHLFTKPFFFYSWGLFSDVSNFEFDSDFQSMNGIDLVGARFQDWRALERARCIECVYQIWPGRSPGTCYLFAYW